MNVYTSDGLLVEQTTGADGQTLDAEYGQRLITIYRLFLQLHHSGSGAMRIKDMLKPDAGETASDSNSNVNHNSGDKTADRRSNANLSTATALTHNNWNSMPCMPESASAYSSSIAAVSTGTPYPMFLLSSNAIPQTHRLRGFPSGRPIVIPGVLSKNNNRSCNGCEEIPLRWSLLSKQIPTAANTLNRAREYGATAALQDKENSSQQRSSGNSVECESDTGAGAGTVTAAAVTAGSAHATSAAKTVGSDRALLTGTEEGEHLFSNAAVAGTGRVATTTTNTAAATAAAAASPVPRVFASGWYAAELQVHTTHRVLICTATELPLDVDGVVEDGNAPLVFCCYAQSNVS